MNERNPYRPGKARVGGVSATSPDNKRPAGLLIAAILEAWTAGYTAWTAPSTLREFKTVRAHPDAAERRKMKLALWIFGVLFGLSIAWAAFALYVPIFKLGSVV